MRSFYLDMVEWVAAGIDSKNVWSFRCLLAKITSLVNSVKRNTCYQFNRVKGGSMKLKAGLFTYILNLATTELKMSIC